MFHLTDSNHYTINCHRTNTKDSSQQKQDTRQFLQDDQLSNLVRNLLEPIKTIGHIIQTDSFFTCNKLAEVI